MFLKKGNFIEKNIKLDSALSFPLIKLVDNGNLLVGFVF